MRKMHKMNKSKSTKSTKCNCMEKTGGGDGGTWKCSGGCGCGCAGQCGGGEVEYVATGGGMLGMLFVGLFAIIGLALLGLGIYILSRKPLYPSQTMGIIKSSTCVNNDCTVTIQYTPDGDSATSPITTEPLIINGSIYKQGDSIKINYDPNNPHSIIINLISPKVFGGIFVAIGGAILLLIGGFYYVSRSGNNSINDSNSSNGSNGNQDAAAAPPPPPSGPGPSNPYEQ